MERTYKYCAPRRLKVIFACLVTCVLSVCPETSPAQDLPQGFYRKFVVLHEYLEFTFRDFMKCFKAITNDLHLAYIDPPEIYLCFVVKTGLSHYHQNNFLKHCAVIKYD